MMLKNRWDVRLLWLAVLCAALAAGCGRRARPAFKMADQGLPMELLGPTRVQGHPDRTER